MPSGEVAIDSLSNSDDLAGEGRVESGFAPASARSGPPAQWPAALQKALTILLSIQRPLLVCWGAAHHCFYNSAFARGIDPEHPGVMRGAVGAERWPEVWHRIGPHIDHVLNGGGATRQEHQRVRLAGGDSEPGYWTFEYDPIADENSPTGVGGVLVLCTDTTHQVLNEQRQTFLIELDDALRHQCDAERIIATAIHALGRFLRANRVGFAQIQPDDVTAVLETNYTDGVAPVVGAYALDSFGPHNIRRQRAGETVVWNDVALDTAGGVDLWAVIDTRAFVAVPLVREGRFRAGLYVDQRHPRVWTSHEVELIERVAARIWDAVERARSEAQLLEATQRFEFALQGMSVTLAHQDRDLRYTWLYNRKLQLPLSDLIGKTDADLFPPDDATALLSLKRDVLRSGKSQRQSVSISVPQGRRHFDLLVEPLIAGNGAIEGVRSASFDITDLKNTEMALRASEERMRLATEATAVGLWEFDVPAQRFRWDAQMFRIYGRAPTEDGFVDYASWKAAVWQPEPAAGETEARGPAPSGRQMQREFRIRRESDGALRHIRTIETLRHDENGDVISVMGTTLDVTERKRAEAQHQATFDNAAVGMAHVALDGRLLRVNQQLCNIVGCTRAELMTRTIADLMVDEGAADAGGADHGVGGDGAVEGGAVGASAGGATSWRALIAGDIDTHSLETRLRASGSEPVWASLTLSVMRDELRAPDYLIAVVVDITARRTAELAVMEREARLESLANAMPQLVWIGRPDGSLEYVNHRLCEYTGLPEAVVKLAETGTRVVHPDDWEPNATKWREAVLKGEAYTLEQRLRRHDGVYRWFLVRAHPDLNADGKVVRWFGTSTDIDESKRLQSDLLATEAALRDLDMRKDLFLATLSHELRNPLAPIRNAAQILGASGLAPQRLQWAQAVIQRQVKHMAWLLDDLLDVARITQGKLELRREWVSVAHVVDAAVETARPQIDDKKHQLIVQLPAVSPVLHADPLRLSQVLSNLLTNAAKYTDPGGRIELFCQLDNGTAVLTVRDNGIGIAPESIERIFDMFSQEESGSARSDGGLGIGLALVKGLVQLHGGRVEARSAGRGCGSTFTIRLPMTEPETDADAPGARASSASAKSGRRVLIADDNVDSADSLAMLVEMSGHDVRVAHGGRAALALAQAFRPDLVILDIGMPDLTGYEVAAALRRESWGKQILLVALTGWGQERDRERSAVAGFDEHLTKPIDADRLAGLLRTSDFTKIDRDLAE